MSTPAKWTTPARLRLFFETNPDEELTYADIQDKFSCSYQSAVKSVKKLGELESVFVIRLKAKGVAS